MRNSKGQFIKKYNDYLMLTNNRIGVILNKEKIALIDAEDYELIKNYTWHARYDNHINDYYVYSKTSKNKCESMHRIIMGAKNSKILVDHVNHDALNNTKTNLRLVTYRGNGRNRKGIEHYNISVLNGKNKRFRVQITVNGKFITRKVFKTLEEAILHRDSFQLD